MSVRRPGRLAVKDEICDNGCVIAACCDAVLIEMSDVPYPQVSGDPDGVETVAGPSEVLAPPGTVCDGQWSAWTLHSKCGRGFWVVITPAAQYVLEIVNLAWPQEEIISWLAVQV